MRPFPRRAALLLIGSLALADLCGAAWLWVLWGARHDQQAVVHDGRRVPLSAGSPNRIAPGAAGRRSLPSS